MIKPINKNKAVINYDSKSDIVYILTKKGKEEEFVEISPGINVEFNEHGEVIGIEIMNASKFLKPIFKPLSRHIQTAIKTN